MLMTSDSDESNVLKAAAMAGSKDTFEAVVTAVYRQYQYEEHAQVCGKACSFASSLNPSVSPVDFFCGGSPLHFVFTFVAFREVCFLREVSRFTFHVCAFSQQIQGMQWSVRCGGATILCETNPVCDWFGMARLEHSSRAAAGMGSRHLRLPLWPRARLRSKRS